MIISLERKNELEKLYQSFLNNDKIKKMMEIPMHRGSNCYVHSFKVAKLSVKKALKKKEANLESIIIASILHDYYLYDWRKDKERKKNHGKHPFVAAENAKRDFDISDEVKRIIECHMYPFNKDYKPTTLEEKIVAKCDTKVATIEFFSSAKHKRRVYQKTLQKIATLF